LISFHLSQAGHDVNEEASRGGAGIDRVGDAFELDSLFVDQQELYSSLDRSPRTVFVRNGLEVAENLTFWEDHNDRELAATSEQEKAKSAWVVSISITVKSADQSVCFPSQSR
jgi:hypothetical protein